MTDETVSRLKEMLAKATALPWFVYHREPRFGYHEPPADFIHAGPEPRDDTGFNVVARMFTTHGYDGAAEREANAALIVEAINALPSLLASLEQGRAAKVGKDAVERAARAMYARVGKAWEDAGERTREIYLDDARAAIASLSLEGEESAGFDKAVAAIEQWAGGFYSEVTRARLNAIVADLRNNRTDILSATPPLSREAIRAEAWQDIETAPKDGRLLWLAVDYDPDRVGYDSSDHPLDDASIAAMIGFNNDDNVLPGEGQGWQFAGWCWTHDHFTEGRGKVIAWREIGFDIDLDDEPAIRNLLPTKGGENSE